MTVTVDRRELSDIAVATPEHADGHKHPRRGEQAERHEADGERFGYASIDARHR